MSFPLADEVVVSPDGKWVAFQESDNVWVSPFPYAGVGGTTLRLDRNRPRLPATRLTREGGLYPTWRNATTLDYGSADRFFSYSINSKRADTAHILETSIETAEDTGTIWYVRTTVQEVTS
jgi:hypothetical protein